MKRAKKAPRDEIEARARARSLNRVGENRIYWVQKWVQQESSVQSQRKWQTDEEGQNTGTVSDSSSLNFNVISILLPLGRE